MRFVKRILHAIRSFFGRPFRYAAAEWNRISARERRLLAALAAAFCGCAVMLVGYLVFDASQAMRQANADMREAIDMIAKHSDEYRDAKEKVRALQARIGTEPPQ